MLLRNHNAELYFGIILKNYVTELSCEKESRDPRDVPGANWELWGPPGVTPATLQGTHPDHKKTTKLQRQELSLAASESFHCNAAPQEVLDRFVMYATRMEPLWSPGSPMEGQTNHSKIPCAPDISAHIYICIYIYVYTYIYIYIYTCTYIWR